MVIKIDVDGVIRNISNPMCDLFNELTGSNMTPEDIRQYDVEKAFRVEGKFPGATSAADYFFNVNAERVFGAGNKYGIYPGADEAIRMLRKDGYEIIICTWQTTLKNKIMTLEFLDSHGIEYDDIMFTRDKWRVAGDIIVDDNPEFLLDSREEAYPLIIDMPYNRKKSLADMDRFGSLMEVVMEILKEER